MAKKKKIKPSDAELALAAYARADAWARSEPGTPYGSSTPTLNPSKERHP